VALSGEEDRMKGIVLAGGTGSRLDPVTRVACKQLQPVYDKPMIYYPLSTLLEAGIRTVLLISTPSDITRFEELLGDGSQWGMEISYATQVRPAGIAESLIIGEDFIDGDDVVLILGDNIFHGDIGLVDAVSSFGGGATIFGYPVRDPERYGVVEVADDGSVVSIVEKPREPRSNIAVTGLYIYEPSVVDVAGRLTPSDRGELEITDVNRWYAEQGRLSVVTIPRGAAWLDSGTHESLLDASNFVATIERRQGLKIACLEEIALANGAITRDALVASVDSMPASSYREYLVRILGEPAS
jgi:glucose-1-phosphate thymidylyltransferase